MFDRRMHVLVFVSWFLASSDLANATMPMLTEAPKRPTAAACGKWAAEQSDDALEMWGIQPNGKTSNSIALDRLKRSCMGESRPGIVGFGSSVGFDDAYCEKHAKEHLCLNRHQRETAPRTEEQLEKAKEAAKNSDFATAFRIWEPLARQGNAHAQYEIGIMYYYGESVRRDFAKALMWRQKAARQGHTAAQLDIGVQYSNGDGVRIDHVEATKWFRQAADWPGARPVQSGPELRTRPRCNSRHWRSAEVVHQGSRTK